MRFLFISNKYKKESYYFCDGGLYVARGSSVHSLPSLKSVPDFHRLEITMSCGGYYEL